MEIYVPLKTDLARFLLCSSPHVIFSRVIPPHIIQSQLRILTLMTMLGLQRPSFDSFYSFGSTALLGSD